MISIPLRQSMGKQLGLRLPPLSFLLASQILRTATARPHLHRSEGFHFSSVYQFVGENAQIFVFLLVRRHRQWAWNFHRKTHATVFCFFN